ncbi:MULTISPECIES: DUF7144 family membrane protein [Amycolatopsis]|uniref:DUF7144 domain-containing protein n=1 Tax=Amycolatopsis thermoflava TaxID=84480 RepID=A0A3N2H787_9PSEU|nr:hypothetical protein [Amycolatopsis thermoflava]ROS44764.1 hypothetical protein EDD35_7215 [Amycolatopsis thermoflava]
MADQAYLRDQAYMSSQRATGLGRVTEERGSGWLLFGAVMVVLAGLFTTVMGIVALAADDHYVVGPEGTLVVDLTGWGWIHLVVGVLAVATGVALGFGAMWARVVAVLLAGFNALSHLAFLNVAPVQSTIVIAIDVLVIWAVVAHGRE